jgi:hypothetical protein
VERKSASREVRGTARRELIAIQKRVWRRLRHEIQASLAEPAANVSIYLEEYERELRTFQAPCSRDDLLASVLSAEIVYVGDYHTLRQSQKTLVRLLAAAALSGREIVVALEMVHAADQAALDLFMKETIDEAAFRRAIRYEETWGFDWRNYSEIFALARRRNVRVVGMNSDPKGHTRDHLLERDFRAAEVVVRETLERPRALVFVFDGDLHVARDHLPMIVDSLLERAGKKREKTIVHQNSEAIYWALASQRQEQEVSIVRLDRDAFCILNASPIEKLQSYLNWQAERDELEPKDDSGWAEILAAEDEDDDAGDEGEELSTGADYTEQVHGFLKTLAHFLGIERDDLDDFELFTVKDLDFLDYLAERFTKRELADLKRQVASGESYFIPKGNIIYLGDLSVSNAAEEVAHFLHWKCSGIGTIPKEPVHDFYLRAITEALGFFGSLVVNHKRDCWRETDCEQFVARKSARDASPEDRFQRLACQLVLQHKKNERRRLETGRWARLAKIYEQPAEMHLRITHMLGHMLGDKLYNALVAGAIEKEFIRGLFFEKHPTPESAFERYMDLVARTQKVVNFPR